MTIVLVYNQYIRRVVALLALVCAVSVFLYGTFLLMAVAHAASIASTIRQVRTVTTEVSKLESTYLTLTKSLTIGDATSLGYIKPAAIAVIYATTPGGLTLNR